MKIPLFKTHFTDSCRLRILSDMETILGSGHLMMGPYKDQFEQLFSETLRVPHAVSVNSCTTALTICLKYYDVADFDVLVPSGSFITSISSILFAGGRPVLVDMNPETLSFDLDDLERKRTPRTKGIIWVHLTGFITPEYEKIVDYSKVNDLFLVEDAAQALGAKVDGLCAGSIGDAGCFSFYPTKIITTGTGGMITTKDEGLRNYARKMRLFGKDLGTNEVVDLGNDWFLDEIRACIGYHQLSELSENISRRREIAQKYAGLLKTKMGMNLLNVPKENNPSYYQFPIFLDRAIDTQGLIEKLKNEYGIESKVIYLPCHKEKVFRKYDDGTLSRTEESDREIEYVVDSLTREIEYLI
jgi:perosamine synthetase